VDAHFEHMPRAYFNFRKPSTIANHLRQFREFYEQVAESKDDMALMPVLRWEDKPAEGCSKLVVCGWDRHLLLARVAGRSQRKASASSAPTSTSARTDLVLDVFRVSTTNFQPVTGENTRKRVQKAVHEALRTEDFDFSDRIPARSKLLLANDLQVEVDQWVYVNNRISPDQTVVELQAADRRRVCCTTSSWSSANSATASPTPALERSAGGGGCDLHPGRGPGRKIADMAAVLELKAAIENGVLNRAS